ncbi:metallophosphoesterase family protein [Marinilactibacillus kalidii]|uniref:metallophosphoesterase family protein n=1 Tax=Marinilactibacillus kalidii TaxID=2820274 RepID=UPI001ABDB70E|nr:metallophosphoesterase family protein [Marinilactibacillus kalidii]
MKEHYFVIGDIHGQITMLEQLLQKWNREKQQLVFVGDLGDRGENPKACFERARQLVLEEGAICLRGNHEEMLLNFMNHPEQYIENYAMNGGLVTINSFIDEEIEGKKPKELAEKLQQQAPWLKPFIESLPLKVEWGNYLIVHAGVDLTIKDWKETSNQNLVWIREGFYDQPNNTGKTIIFGHTVTAMLNEKQSDASIWLSGDGKIGIDGGAVYGGSLHGIVIDQSGMIEQYSIPNTGYAFNNLLRKES